MGVSPTGYGRTPTRTLNVTNAAWVAVANPNMAHGVIITATQDIFIRWEQPQPAPALTGFSVWAQTYYSTRSDHWLGYSEKANPIAGIGPLWVRAQGAAATVDVEWMRE